MDTVTPQLLTPEQTLKMLETLDGICASLDNRLTAIEKRLNTPIETPPVPFHTKSFFERLLGN